MRKGFFSGLFLAILFLGYQGANAFPRPQKPLTLEQLTGTRPSGNFRGGVNFRAIVALSNCSGSVVRFETSQPSDFGMVLTNGHCLQDFFGSARTLSAYFAMIKPGQNIIDQSSDRTFALLSNDGSKSATLRASRVMLSTMTGTDVTLYRLTETFQELSDKYKIQPLVISSKHPVVGTPISIVSGYWKRGYVCHIDDFIYSIHEGGYQMFDSIRYSSPGCEIIGGTSGSPIINPATYELIGINNTTNESGERCTMDNPCEVDAKGQITVRTHAGYGQETYILYSCLNAQRQIDASMTGCFLNRKPTLK